MTFQQIEENNERCETEVLRLQRHYDTIVEKLFEIKKKHKKLSETDVQREIPFIH